MLVTSYPVSCDWGASKDVGSNNLKIDTTDTSETSDSDADTITPAPALCSVSNTSMTQEMINIETTVSETFTPNKNDNDNDDTSDYFSTHFENDIQKLGAESDTTETFHDNNCHPNVSSSSSRSLEHKESLSKAKNKHPDPLTNGNVNRGLPSSSASPDHENCWTPSSTPAPASVSILPSHRVTFNDKNEVASQDRDGTFTVTYSQLGEKISQKSSGEHLPKRPGGLKVQFGETSCVETVELPFKLTEYSRNVTFDEDSLLSYKSSKIVEEEWDNPFQPEGEVSQDAEKIIQLWRGGKLTEDEDLQENLNSLTPDLAKDESLQSDISNEASDESDEKKIPNGVNGHSTAAANPKISTPTKIPVINTSDMNYIVMVNNGTEKHKNKIKKHCSLM